MTIDPRLAHRRRTVAEDKAKQNLSRLLKFLAVVVAAGALVWLVFSPWLSITRVDTTGIEISSGNMVLAQRGVIAGTPMIQVSELATEAALLEDPWVKTAEVDKDWPNRVIVSIVERSPVAWTNTESGWTRRAIDGIALPSDTEPDNEMARIDMPHLADAAAETAPSMLGALQFIEALPTDLRSGTIVTTHEDELWASVAGYQVRLGRGVEMREKALSLDALLDRQIPKGSLLTLIAPTHPSYKTPEAGAGEVKEVVDATRGGESDGERAGTGAENDETAGDGTGDD